ncbi:synaptonemal complex protein 3-like [Ischnura elegans]|uniref:synaptonemal complex protein 3-like n=1 Tax=Ischnura elegans TaxID=197161 RepID=UPI001ED8B08E|nr:synaptonemal complex protein 3-like [Ischnura elegans]XP_046394367.1 synaptonemal complex protein 3-like [Ischnura elegans]XP_046394368.1 synaptonemal complex protein 3-like [Ischnura elegans]
MPRARGNRRKRCEANIPSSGESIEDEDLILNDSPKKEGSLSLEPTERNKDQGDSNTGEDLSNIDPENEMSKMLRLLGNDMTKSVSAKKRKMEKFTDAAININLSKMTKVWSEQHKKRSATVEMFNRQVQEHIKQWEDDLNHQNERAEKINNILLQNIKVQQQVNASNVKRMSQLRIVHESFIKNVKNLEENFSRINETANQEMKTELLLLQKKILMETQQQDLLEVRKSVQTLLFS